MSQDQLNFWSAIVQIIPVLALAIIVEFRWLGDASTVRFLRDTGRGIKVFTAAYVAALFLAMVTGIFVEFQGLIQLHAPVSVTAHAGWHALEIVAVLDVAALLGAALLSPIAGLFASVLAGVFVKGPPTQGARLPR